MLAAVVARRRRPAGSLPALVAVLGLTAVAGCSGGGHRPVATGPLSSEHLPPGVLYLLAGPSDTSYNLWEVKGGRQVELTHDRAGYGISSFDASRAGIVLADASSGVDELARLTARGPQRLPDDHASAPCIDGAGRIAFVKVGYPLRFLLEVKASFVSPARVVYRASQPLILMGWGPGGALVAIGDDYPPGDGTGPERVIIVDGSGARVKAVPLDHPGLVVWSATAPGMAVESWTNRTVYVSDTGQVLSMPTEWSPLTWSPDGRELLVASSDRLGLWVPGRGAVKIVATITPGVAVGHAAWLDRPAEG